MKIQFVLCALLALLLTACEFSLAGDITPPPDAVLFSEAMLISVESPVAAPDLTAGAEIYANRCAACHGPRGLGDGEEAAQLPFFPSAIGDPDLARSASPEDWFRVLSAGRLQRYMPPFESALTVQQRWDVLAYVYSLGWDEETLARGSELYVEHQPVIDDLLSGLSPVAIDLDAINALDLSLEDSLALTAYLQALALKLDSAGAPVEAADPPELSDVDGVAASLTGKVIYASGGQFPSGLEARLYGFDRTDQVVSEIVPVASDGEFYFENIPLANDRIFFVQVDFQGLSFFSEFLTVDGQTGIYTLDVPIYDVTSEVGELAVEAIQLVLDFSKAGVVRVVESVRISNLGDRAVVPAEGKPVLHFSLPAEASKLSFEEGELGDRYLPDDSGFGDTRAVIPGINSYSLLFAYELPYQASVDLPITIELPTRSIAVFIPEGNLELAGDGFSLQGSQLIDGKSYLAYGADAAFSTGDEVLLEIRGAHPLGAAAASLTDNEDLLVGLAALTVAVGFAWLWMRSLPGEAPSSTERILAQIAALDERYERGGLARSGYTKQRAALKERLRRALGTGKRK